MDTALWAAKTGLDAQHTRLTLISNNIANINTTGYKRVGCGVRCRCMIGRICWSVRR